MTGNGQPLGFLRLTAAIRAGKGDVEDCRVGEGVGNNQILAAVAEGVVVGEVPVARRAVGTRADGIAIRVTGPLLHEPASSGDLHHRRHIRALGLEFFQV